MDLKSMAVGAGTFLVFLVLGLAALEIIRRAIGRDPVGALAAPGVRAVDAIKSRLSSATSAGATATTAAAT